MDKKRVSFKNKIAVVFALAAGTAVVCAILFMHAVVIKNMIYPNGAGTQQNQFQSNSSQRI